MGFSSLSVVFSAISETYCVDHRIAQLYDRKFRLSRLAQGIGAGKAQIFCESGSGVTKFNIRKMGLTTSGPEQVENPSGFAPGLVQDRPDINPAYDHFDTASASANQRAAEADLDAQQMMIMDEEKQIDMQLEELKAQREALTKQKDEIQRSIGQNIASTFKNNYGQG